MPLPGQTETSTRLVAKAQGGVLADKVPGRRVRWLGLILIGAFAAAGLAERYHHHAALAAARVEFVNGLRVSEIESWIAERVSEARFIRTSTYMAELYAQYKAGDEGARNRLMLRLGEFRRGGASETVIVIERSGHVIGAEPAGDSAVGHDTLDALTKALATGQPQLTDPFDDEQHIDLVVPFIHSGNPPALAAILRANPKSTVLRNSNSWPVPGQAASIVLWRADGVGWRAISHINDSPSRSDTRDRVSDESQMPGAAFSALSAAGIARSAKDSSGRRVIGAARRIEGTPWALSTHIKLTEVASELTGETIGILGATVLAALALWNATHILRQRQALRVTELELDREIARATQLRIDNLQFTQRIADSNPGMVGYWDRGLVCRFASRSYREWFGKSAGDALGSDVTAFFDEESLLAIRPRMEATLNGASQVLQRNMIALDGTSRHMLVSYSPHWSQGMVIGLFVSIADVTALKQAELRLQRLNAQLSEDRDRAERANNAKSIFLADMSHEIRTPMNAIIGLTDLMRRESQDSRTAERLSKVADAAQHLLVIINDILDLSKIEAGKLELDLVDFSLDAQLGGVMDLLSERARANGVELVINSSGVPDALRGDATRLSQALLNLLGNAIKFTARGSVVLVCSVVNQDEAGMMLRFDVRDTGIGIDADALRGLFYAFSQADPSVNRRFGGTGLGLSITRRLADLMGGEAGACSEPGTGSRFWFTARLPWPSTRPLLSESLATGRRVLVVGDLLVTRDAIVEMLLAKRVSVGVAVDSNSALEALRVASVDSNAEKIDMLVVDWNLANNGAANLMCGLSDEPRYAAAMPAIAVSRTDDQATVDAANDAGFSALLRKPVRSTLLLETISRLLEPPVDSGSSTAAQPIAPQKSESILREHHAGVCLLLVEDDPVNQEITGELLRIAGVEVAIAETGEQALMMAHERIYSLALMDVQMAGMNGLDATRELRRIPGWSKVPILAITADVFAEDRERCLAAGMNDHVSKPVEAEALYSTLLRWLPEEVEHFSANSMAGSERPGRFSVDGIDRVARASKSGRAR